MDDIVYLQVMRAQVAATMASVKAAHVSLDAFRILLDSKVELLTEASPAAPASGPTRVTPQKEGDSPVPIDFVDPAVCDHPSNYRRDIRTMGKPNRFHCSLCGEVVEPKKESAHAAHAPVSERVSESA